MCFCFVCFSWHLGPQLEKETAESFHTFLEGFEPGSRNFTLLTGWFFGKKKGTKGEDHDLLIIDGQRKVILNFECKLTITIRE
jgi:hypothetical protein